MKLILLINVEMPTIVEIGIPMLAGLIAQVSKYIYAFDCMAVILNVAAPVSTFDCNSLCSPIVCETPWLY